MGKALKVLVVLEFIFVILAFAMGLKNFSRRELLIGRTHALEDFAKKIVTTVESEAPEAEGVPNHSEWDVDDVTDRPNDNPRMSTFWDSYDDKLEAHAVATVSFRNKEQQLSSYYKMTADGKVEKDLQGRPKTDGKGTMKELLDEAYEKAKDQKARLDSTRDQLKAVREELEDLADALNEQKKLRRDNLAEISRQNGRIAQLEDTATQKDGDIARLNREKNDLNDEITSLNDQIAERDQSIDDLKAQVERLRADIVKLTYDSTPGSATASATKRGDEQTKDAWTPGVKGKVFNINGELSFVIVKLTPEAAREIAPAEGQAFSPVEMMVRRKAEDGSEKIVTRLRIVNPPDKDNLAIADNMYGWEQIPVEVGDDVVY